MEDLYTDSRPVILYSSYNIRCKIGPRIFVVYRKRLGEGDIEGVYHSVPTSLIFVSY